jgi:hypothetical protein
VTLIPRLIGRPFLRTNDRTRNRAQKKRSGRKSIADLIGHHRGARAEFAQALSRLSKQEVTWARVNHWVEKNSVPKNMVLYVHRLTGAPFADLLR